LHLKWSEYREIYGTNSDRVDLLNRAAPEFFRVVQDTLWEGTILHIARLTDRPTSRGRANLTIQRFPHLVDLEIKSAVETKVDEAIAASDFCRDWRNRRIAHSDFDLAVDRARPLHAASRKALGEAMASIVAVMNTVSTHYLDSETYFLGAQSRTGAESLLELLKAGLAP
jgi:hypothetical protein